MDVSSSENRARNIWDWAERRINNSQGSSLVVSNYKDIASFARKARDAYADGKTTEGDAFMSKLEQRAQAYNIKLP
jgi:hypothetical protein